MSFSVSRLSTCRCHQYQRRCGVAQVHRSIASRPLPGSFGRQPRIELQGAPSRSIKCNGLFGLGLPELAVIAGVAALVFGPSKLPELGKGLGKTIKSFQTAAKEFETELKTASSEEPVSKTEAEAEKAKKD